LGRNEQRTIVEYSLLFIRISHFSLYLLETIKPKSMKLIFSYIVFVCTYFIAQAQNNDRKAILKEEDFVPSCIQNAQGQMGQSATTYCSCVYEQIINELSDEEFEKMYALISKGKSSFAELPGVKNIFASCLDDVPKDGDQNQSSERESKLKDTFVKNCSVNLNKNKNLRKSINAVEFCECSWYKIVDRLGLDKMNLNLPSKEDSEAMKQFATECIEEQLK
jgi:hypothetical protein